MKKLEDFQAEKIEVESIYGGYVPEVTYTICRDADGGYSSMSDSQD